MFKDTVVASDLRKKMAHYFEMVTDDNVIQVLHRGSDIKVIMTQEHYLDLLSTLALYERDPNAQTVKARSAQEIGDELNSEMSRYEHEEELKDVEDDREMGRGRIRKA